MGGQSLVKRTMTGSRWLCLVWLCVMVDLVAGDHSDYATLDASHDESLGEAVTSAPAAHGFFCTPKGQMKPDYAYSDKDCAANGETQQCGEVWCCAHASAGAQKYVCTRDRRTDNKNCADLEKPVCSGPKPTGADGDESGPACQDSHDAICEAAKAYGHCKHSSYASECPSSCGQSGGDDGQGARVKSVIAQVEAKAEEKNLARSDDASEVAKNAQMKMNKRHSDAMEAANQVQAAEALEAKAKRKVSDAEGNAMDSVAEAAEAGKAHVKDVKASAKKEVADVQEKVSELKKQLKSENKEEQKTKRSLRSAEAAADGVSIDKGAMTEAKAAVNAAKNQEKAAAETLEKDKALVAKASDGSKQEVKSQRGVVAAKQKALEKVKDARANEENLVADAAAKLTQLRAEQREEGPEEQQVMVTRSKLERAEQKLNYAEKEDETAQTEEEKLDAEVNKQKAKVDKAKEELPGVAKQAKEDAEKKTAELEEEAEEKEEAIEEKKLEGQAEMKIEETVFTDADIRSKAEAAFVRTENKIDSIFDNVKPLVLNPGKKPVVDANSTEGVVSAADANNMVQTDNAADSAGDDQMTRNMANNMMQAKETMATAKKKINQLQKIVDDDSLAVDVPKKVVREAKAEVKKEADIIGEKLGKEEGEKEGKKEEKIAVKEAEDKAEKAVEELKDEEAQTEDAQSKAKDKKADAEANLDAKKQEVEDLKEDVAMEEKQVKKDDVPSKDILAAEAAVNSAKAKLRKETSRVRAARASKKSAKKQLKADKEEMRNEEAAAEKKIEMVESRAEDKADKAEMKLEEAKTDLRTEKSKEKSASRVADKVSRLKATVKAEKGEIREAKKEEGSAEQEEAAVAEKAEEKVRKAEDEEGAVEQKAIAKAKERGAVAVSNAKDSLADTKNAVEKAKQQAEETASAASGVAKLCTKLVPPNAESKDAAPLCAVVLKEQHCNYFDYARYCAKSCGTCVL